MKKTIFLDRDGVINELVISREEGVIDSPHSAKQFKLIKGTGEALKILKKMGYQTIIISNQPGIAKGHYDINEFNKIKQKMERNLFQYNIKLDGQYYCLHHPDAKIFQYRKICECRKPGVKNFVDAVTKHDVDVKKSFFIGDGIADMQLANRVDCRGIFIGNVNSTLLKIFKEKHLNPFYIAHDLLEAATFIKKEIKLIPKPEK